MKVRDVSAALIIYAVLALVVIAVAAVLFLVASRQDEHIAIVISTVTPVLGTLLALLRIEQVHDTIKKQNKKEET